MTSLMLLIENSYGWGNPFDIPENFLSKAVTDKLSYNGEDSRLPYG